ADFTELVVFVKRVAPKKIFTLHGFAADFAQTLRGLGFDARALSEKEQLALPLEVPSFGIPVSDFKVAAAAAPATTASEPTADSSREKNPRALDALPAGTGSGFGGTM